MSLSYNKQELTLWLVSLPLIIYFIWKALIPAWQTVNYDFPNYHLSSQLWMEGKGVSQFYDNDWFEKQGYERGIETPSRFTPFPPISALLMTPLSGLDLLTAKRVWTLFNLILLLFSIYLLHRQLKLSLPHSFIVLFIMGNALGTNFRLGQFYLLILVTLLCVYRLYQKGYFKWAGSLLAIIAVIKYLPVVFISGFLRKHTLIAFGVVFLLLIAMQWPLFGEEAMQAYVQVLTGHLQGDIAGQTAYAMAFQSYDSFFANLFVFERIHNPSPFIDWTGGKIIGKLVVSASIFLISFVVWRNYAKAQPELKKDVTLVITGMAIMTLLPASASYHFVLLLFPFSLLLKLVWRQSSWFYRILLLLLFGFIANSSFNTIPFRIGHTLPDLILSYPRLWAMTLLTGLTLYLLHTSRSALISN